MNDLQRHVHILRHADNWGDRLLHGWWSIWHANLALLCLLFDGVCYIIAALIVLSPTLLAAYWIWRWLA